MVNLRVSEHVPCSLLCLLGNVTYVLCDNIFTVGLFTLIFGILFIVLSTFVRGERTGLGQQD